MFLTAMCRGIACAGALALLMAMAASDAYGFLPVPPQGVRLAGRVVDSATGQPVIGATVVVAELKRGGVSHRDGSFTIEDLPTGSYTIVASSVGYVERRLPLQLGDDRELLIALASRPVELPEVTVTGHAERDGLTGAPQSATVITGAELERSRGQTLGESLKNVAGVTLLQTGPSIAKPVIRGLHSERVVVVNAGVTQEGQQWGAEHAPEIDPFAIAKIEVLRGAAGVEFGSGAIGGVIRVDPRELPTASGIDGKVMLDAFSNNRQGSGALLLEGGVGGLPGLGWRAQGSARKAGDASTPDYVIGNSGFEELNGSLALGYHGAGVGIEGLYSRFSTELGIFKGSHIGNLADLKRAIANGRPLADYDFGYAIASPRQRISHDLVAVKAHTGFSNAGELELQYGLQRNHRQEFDAHNLRLSDTAALPPSQKPSFGLALTTHTLELKYRHQPGEHFYGSIGASGMRQGNVREGSTLLIPNFRSYGGGVYAIENYLNGDWILNLGARYDYQWTRVYALPAKNIEERAHNHAGISGAAGVIYRFAPNWSVGMNIGTAWRPPGINELYSNDVHHGAAQFEIGDLGLGSERSVNLDLTLRHQSERVRGELSVYNNRIAGFIHLFPDPEPTITIRGVFPTFRYRQTDALLRGIDGSIDCRLTDLLELGASFSIVRGTDLGHDQPLIAMPADRLRLTGRCDLASLLGLEESYLELGGTFVRRQDRYPAGVDYADPPPGYSLLDVSAGALVELLSLPLRLNLSVQNALDASYRDYLSRFRYFSDDPGRNIVLRVQVPFGGFAD